MGCYKRHVDAFSKGLLDLGFQKGDRLGVWLPNNSEWVIAQFATAKTGIILVNINPAYRTHELEYVKRIRGTEALTIVSLPILQFLDL